MTTYHFSAGIVRRAQAGADVPGWLVMHVEGEMRLRGAA